MRDISAKQITLRTARAVGFLACSSETFDQVKHNKVPKGNVMDYAKAGAFLGAKQTQNLIPHCHPVSIDGLNVEFTLMEKGDTWEDFTAPKCGIHMEVTAKSIGRTGIEMEALMAAGTCGMTLYDMLKYMDDPELELMSVKLLKKTGGKTDKNKHAVQETNYVLIQTSDFVKAGQKEDKIGVTVPAHLKKHNCQLNAYSLIDQKPENLIESLEDAVSKKADLILVAGGSGLSKADLTAQTITDFVDVEAPGVIEAMYQFGLLRTPDAMLSQLAAGIKDETLIISIPGSEAGAIECLDAIFPSVLKIKRTLKKQS